MPPDRSRFASSFVNIDDHRVQFHGALGGFHVDRHRCRATRTYMVCGYVGGAHGFYLTPRGHAEAVRDERKLPISAVNARLPLTAPARSPLPKRRRMAISLRLRYGRPVAKFRWRCRTTMV